MVWSLAGLCSFVCSVAFWIVTFVRCTPFARPRRVVTATGKRDQTSSHGEQSDRDDPRPPTRGALKLTSCQAQTLLLKMVQHRIHTRASLVNLSQTVSCFSPPSPAAHTTIQRVEDANLHDPISKNAPLFHWVHFECAIDGGGMRSQLAPSGSN